MNKTILFTLTAALTALTVCDAHAAGSLSDEMITGRIGDANGVNVRVCFDHDVSPSDRREYDVIRHQLRPAPKGTPALESINAGIVRIVSVDSGRHCADARVIRGTARSSDWVAERPST